MKKETWEILKGTLMGLVIVGMMWVLAEITYRQGLKHALEAVNNSPLCLREYVIEDRRLSCQ